MKKFNNPNGDESAGKCPNCYEYGEFEIDLDLSKKENKFIVWCKNCGHHCSLEEFVSDLEEKSIKRTKLIDDILDDKR
jgi:transcription elongation factor Elf1